MFPIYLLSTSPPDFFNLNNNFFWKKKDSRLHGNAMLPNLPKSQDPERNLQYKCGLLWHL